ncbi:MAG: outer membrane protein assembly factor BamA [Pseudomonadota bacterium]
MTLSAARPFLVAILTVVLVGAQAIAQENYTTVVRQIIVTGTQRLEPETVRSYLPITPGTNIDQVVIDEGLKGLFATGLFEDAQMVFDASNGVLQVQVQENPIVNRVIYVGNRRLGDDKFEEEVELEPRAIYTRARAQADAQRMIEVYRRSGRFGATVSPRVRELERNRVDVIFDIDEGPRTGVRAVNFLGNEEFSDAELRGVILTAPSSWWNILESNDNYDPDRLEYDQELLRQHYSQNGFADFAVMSAVAELTPDRKDFIITIEVDEGPKYDFGNVDVNTTLSKLPGETLRRRVPIRSGTVFNSERIEEAEEALTFATGVYGYAFVDIYPRLDRNPETKTIDVTFEVNEGPRVYVEEININGNQQTLDRVIRREMRLVEGDAFNRVLVDRSERRVKGLGFFSEVEVEELPGSAPDRSVLNVNVTEQPTGSFQIGGGVSSNDNFIFNIQLDQRNLAGRGQNVLLDLSASQRTNRARIAITEPYFLGRRLRAGASIFIQDTDFEEAGFVSQSYGFGTNFGFPVSEFAQLGLNYGLRYDNLELTTDLTFTRDENGDLVPSNDLVDPDAIRRVREPESTGIGVGIFTTDRCNVVVLSDDLNCENNGEFVTSSIGYTLRMDRTNDPIVPSRGYAINFSQNFAGIGGDVNYYQSTLRSSYYHPLPFRFIGSLKFQGGYIQSFNDDGVRRNDRFFLGGGRGFRGFDVAGVGPRLFDADDAVLGRRRGQAIGARAYAVGSAEALIPLPLPPSAGLRASLFADMGVAGLVNDRDEEIFNDPSIPRVDLFGDSDPDDPLQANLDPRVTAGVVVNWRSPFGPVQFVISEAVVVQEYDRPEGFRFSAGGQF